MKKNKQFPFRFLIEKTAISEREFEALTSTPEYYGEESFGGSMPNPEADDDTLKSQQEFGFYTEIDTPQQEQLNIQKQIEQAEKARRRRRDTA